MNAERAEREAEQRFRDYRAEASCTCGVYRLALSPKLPPPPADERGARFDPTDPRLYSEGSSYESALAALSPPAPDEIKRLR